MRRLDGLRAKLDVDGPSTPPKPRRRILRALGLVGGATVVTVGLVVSLTIQPLLAALPFDSWNDRLTLTELLRPGVYLVVFQNPRELRPTGGFMGSFAELEVGWGLSIKRVQVEANIYTRAAAYREHLQLDPPDPIRSFLGDAPWALHDSNWALDFSEAAQTMAWFYQQEGGRPVDGVIAVDARLLERLLVATGPLQVPGRDLTLTAASVIGDLQEEIEKTYWKDTEQRLINQPKSIFADMIPELMIKLKQLDPALMVQLMTQAFTEKEVQIYHRDADLAQVFRAANWDGAVPEVGEDYLYMNEANLTAVDGLTRVVGAKSSWSIRRRAELRREVTADDRTLHTLTLSRVHEGAMAWPDGPNDSFLRIAVPVGATLLTARRAGQDIASEVRVSLEAGKTVFGLWSRLKPSESDQIELVYTTSWLEDTGIYLQRQPGVPAYPVTVFTDGETTWQGNLTQDISIE